MQLLWVLPLSTRSLDHLQQQHDQCDQYDFDKAEEFLALYIMGYTTFTPVIRHLTWMSDFCYVFTICNSWAVPNAALEKLDTTHRRHLRRILNVYWPRGKIRNDELYKKCLDPVKLSDRVKKMRWTMLGHIYLEVMK